MSGPLSRREFAGLVAVGTILTGSTATAPAEDKPAATAKPNFSPLEHLVDLVREKYPHEQLDEAALDEVRQDLRHFLSRSKVLSKFPLANSDEPGFVFSAWRADLPGN